MNILYLTAENLSGLHRLSTNSSQLISYFPIFQYLYNNGCSNKYNKQINIANKIKQEDQCTTSEALHPVCAHSLLSGLYTGL